MTHDGAQSGIVWPAVSAPRGSALPALVEQFDSTQWWSAQAIQDAQLRQLAALLRHAYATVAFYKDRFDAIDYRPGARISLEELRALPLLTRQDVQNAGAPLHTRNLPAQFGLTSETSTSGSTGEPVRLRATEIDQLFWQAFTVRDHLWHRRDVGRKLASIRVFPHGRCEPPHGLLADNWGPPASSVWTTGPMAMLSLNSDVPVQARWLLEQDPAYLLTYPSNLDALIDEFVRRGDRLPSLREVRTVGEIVSPRLRDRCLREWGVPIVDMYSSQELGYIALQCPAGSAYHVMAESVLVEVLDAEGHACAPGEVGRLVITRLHNFATPLIRYELNDYAEAGAPCSCGRGLPTLSRIIGRTRNMLTLPGGERRWPLVGFDRYRDIAPVRQYQFVQYALDALEVRLVVERAVTGDEERQLAAVIRDALGYPFELKFSYFREPLARTAGGKFEEFISAL